MPLFITTKVVTASPVAANGSPSVNGLLGIITDSSPGDPASDFTVSVNWGDGTPLTAATVDSVGSGVFVIDGSHVYATGGNFTLSETITYTPVPLTQVPSTTVNAVAPTTPAANLHSLYVGSNRPFSGTVANFVDSNLADTAATFSPTVQWGDGTSSASIVAGSAGSFSVSGAHTYTTPGTHGNASVTLDGAGLRFMTAVVTEATSDFSASGQSSVLWRQAGGGLALWGMSGATITTSGSVTAGGSAVAPDATWSVAGVGDLDGNGAADVLWRQSGTGTLTDWSMSGSNIVSSSTISAAPDSSWSIADIADFTGDGKADLLWRQSTTGSLALWSMNGSTISASNTISATPDASWSVAASGDFNGDGFSDLLWRQSSTGALAIWNMSGSTIRSSRTLEARRTRRGASRASAISTATAPPTCCGGKAARERWRCG